MAAPDPIERLEEEIKAVEDQIKKAEENAETASSEKEQDYWRQEKSQLRQKESQLRQKESQLREEKSQVSVGADRDEVRRIAREEVQAQKRRRTSKCTESEIGGKILENSREAEKEILKRLAEFSPSQVEKAEAFLRENAALIATLEATSGETAAQKPLSELLTNLVKAAKSEETLIFCDCSASGLLGRAGKADGMLADRAKAPAHASSFLEFKGRLDLPAKHAEAVGQLCTRVEQVRSEQPLRTQYLNMLLDKSNIQLWLMTSQPYQSRNDRTRLLPIQWKTDSEGFRWLWQAMSSRFQSFGYEAPENPLEASFTDHTGEFQQAQITHRITAKPAATHQQGVWVYGARVGDQDVVLKANSDNHATEQEVLGMKFANQIDPDGSHFPKFMGRGIVTINGVERSFIAMEPMGEHIQLRVNPHVLVDIMTRLVRIVEIFQQAGKVHCDISYWNVLMAAGRLQLIDFQTLRDLTEASMPNYATGVAEFMSVKSIQMKMHTVGTELESVMNVMIFIATGGVLPWRHIGFDDPTQLGGRIGMLQYGLDAYLKSSSCEPSLAAMVHRISRLFFPKDKYDPFTVTTQQFLDELHL